MRLLRFLLTLMLILSICAASAEQDNGTQSVVITFLGDCTLGSEQHQRSYETSFDSYVHTRGYDYPFSGVVDILEKDDLTVANLESVFADTESGKVKKTYNFRSSPDFADILTLSSIEAVSLANNHTEDYGRPGIQSTLQALEERNIAWFASAQEAHSVYIYEKNNIKIGFIGLYISYWYNNLETVKADLQTLHDAGCSCIVAVVHGGSEYYTRRDAGMEKLASFFIRYGCCAVIGHHPHVLQGMDVYDGATVLYSLGNFVFGGNKKMRALYTVLAQITFDFDETGRYIGHQLNLIPAQYSGNDEYNDYRPILVQGDAADKALSLIQADTPFILNPYVEGVGAVQDYVQRYDPPEGN